MAISCRARSASRRLASPPARQAHYVSHPDVRFNALKNPAKPSGRRHGLRSTVGFPRSICLLLACCPLMRRSGAVATDFLALGSCPCRFEFLADLVEAGGCGDVSSGALVIGMAGAAATASLTWAMSTLSASVNVSREEILSDVVGSGEAATIGGGVDVPALMAATPPAPLRQRTVSHTVLITANLAWFAWAN